MKFYIKEDRWEDFERNHKKYGFEIDHHGDYEKYAGNGRRLFVYAHSREITDLKIDYTTYWGYAYEGEYRHRTKTYIMDLIADGYIEARKE
jgi:hypothetical protein